MPGLGSSDTTLASVGPRHVSRTVRLTGVFRDQIVRTGYSYHPAGSSCRFSGNELRAN
jgi:hypothetical protein